MLDAELGVEHVTGRLDFLGLVDQVAVLVPEAPKLAVLDALDAEWVRFRVAAETYLAPLAVAAAVWRLRSGGVLPESD